MDKFEYEISQRSVVASRATLNEFGGDGWELVDVTLIKDTRFPLIYTFKREAK
jgi:hypothetical protein